MWENRGNSTLTRYSITERSYSLRPLRQSSTSARMDAMVRSRARKALCLACTVSGVSPCRLARRRTIRLSLSSSRLKRTLQSMTPLLPGHSLRVPSSFTIGVIPAGIDRDRLEKKRTSEYTIRISHFIAII